MTNEDSGKTRNWLIYILLIAGVLFVFILGLIVGSAGGLFYGWVYNPVECVDCTPSQLSESHRFDYVAMVIDSFGTTHDMEMVEFRLGQLSESEALRLLSEHYDHALNQDNQVRADIIREIMLIYHDPGATDQ